ncbi:MAG: YjfI family protein [gamma proteobacterium symbiont of Bathyaustriella thionipta]|nr:YjfI family protein [gamma proteobacterium symbiont of Bathyaustriella thionipta]
MVKKTSAYYQREFRKRLREQGLKKREVWILPENSKRLLALEKQLRIPLAATTKTGVQNMTNSNPEWTTDTLHSALQQVELFSSGQASLELIDGIDASLHIVMHEYGDLPIFLTVSGEQIIAESALWPMSDVQDVALFNDALLRTHKYFPLSAISLDNVGKEGSYYQMYGALSSGSILNSVVFEIETLASNVIQATEAYSEYLTIAIEA